MIFRTFKNPHLKTRSTRKPNFYKQLTKAVKKKNPARPPIPVSRHRVSGVEVDEPREVLIDQNPGLEMNYVFLMPCPDLEMMKMGVSNVPKNWHVALIVQEQLIKEVTKVKKDEVKDHKITSHGRLFSKSPNKPNSGLSKRLEPNDPFIQFKTRKNGNCYQVTKTRQLYAHIYGATINCFIEWPCFELKTIVFSCDLTWIS